VEGQKPLLTPPPLILHLEYMGIWIKWVRGAAAETKEKGVGFVERDLDKIDLCLLFPREKK
jgi:hypothetical protein